MKKENATKPNVDLIDIMDDKFIWKIGGGLQGTYRTLRDALLFTYDFSMGGKSPGQISKLDDSVVIDHPQMHSLWQYLSLIKAA